MEEKGKPHMKCFPHGTRKILTQMSALASQLGGTTGPELVGCSSVKEKRGKDKEKVKSVKEVEQLKLYSHRILAFHYFM